MSTESTPLERNLRKERIGVVTSNSMTKSITVTVERKEKHAKYGKFVKKTSKFMAHDEAETCNIGDTVRLNTLLQIGVRELSDFSHFNHHSA